MLSAKARRAGLSLTFKTMENNTTSQDLREVLDSLQSSSEQARQFAHEIKTLKRAARGVSRLRRALRQAQKFMQPPSPADDHRDGEYTKATEAVSAALKS